jgi:hypothetical protein
MKMAVFWVVAPFSLVELYQRFRGPCCLHHQGDRPDDGLTDLLGLIKNAKSYDGMRTGNIIN